ncbi:hypothetical protein JCM8097_003328 [Rhodosporidiobolus ruineniae]
MPPDVALSALEQLPIELLEAIVQHLPPHSSSIRPLASLAHLASTSKTLHALLSPLVDSHVRLSTVDHVGQFLLASPATHAHLRRLDLVPSLSPSTKSAPPWTAAALEPLLSALIELIELRLSGLADPPRAVSPSLLALPSSLARLELDFGSNVRADNPPSVRPVLVDAAAPARGASLSHAFEPSWAGLFSRLSGLSHLRLANLELGSGLASAFLPDEEVGSSISGLRLRALELEAVELDDEALRFFLSGGQLEALSLERCMGFSRAGLVDAIKAAGGRLRRLDLDCGGATSRTSSATTSPRTPPASPPRSPPVLSASTRSTSGSPTIATACPPLFGVLDSLLPHLSSLTHLSTSGPLFSPGALASFSTHLPHLRELSIASHPHVTPSALLPLLRLSSLKRISLLSAPPSSPYAALPCPSPPWASPLSQQHHQAVQDAAVLEICTAALAGGIELDGEVFERTRERLEWAQREAEKLAGAAGEVKEEKEVRRRRKRPGVAVCG